MGQEYIFIQQNQETGFETSVALPSLRASICRVDTPTYELPYARHPLLDASKP